MLIIESKLKSFIKAEESKFECLPFKELVKFYIQCNYEPSKKSITCYGLKHKFEAPIGYVTQGVLALWLEEWGYEVKASMIPKALMISNSDYTYLDRHEFKVYLKPIKNHRVIGG